MVFYCLRFQVLCSNQAIATPFPTSLCYAIRTLFCTRCPCRSMNFRLHVERWFQLVLSVDDATRHLRSHQTDNGDISGEIGSLARRRMRNWDTLLWSGAMGESSRRECLDGGKMECRECYENISKLRRR